ALDVLEEVATYLTQRGDLAQVDRGIEVLAFDAKPLRIHEVGRAADEAVCQSLHARGRVAVCWRVGQGHRLALRRVAEARPRQLRVDGHLVEEGPVAGGGRGQANVPGDHWLDLRDIPAAPGLPLL